MKEWLIKPAFVAVSALIGIAAVVLAFSEVRHATNFGNRMALSTYLPRLDCGTAAFILRRRTGIANDVSFERDIRAPERCLDSIMTSALACGYGPVGTEMITSNALEMDNQGWRTEFRRSNDGRTIRWTVEKS